MECEVDKVRSDYCINVSLGTALRTVEYTRGFVADPGEQTHLGDAWLDEQELVEPLPAPKDLFATMSLNSVNQRGVVLPNLYDEVSNETQKAFLEKRT